MNVLYDHSIFVMQQYGGISRYFRELVVRMARHGDVEPSVFMGLYVNRYALFDHRRALKRFWGIRRPHVSKTHRFARSASDALFALVAGQWEKDIVHYTTYRLPRTAGKYGRVVTLHDYAFEKIQGVREPYKDEALAKADAIICISESTRRDAIEISGVNPSKLHRIYHGCSLGCPPQDAFPLRAPYVLFVGRRGGYKNFSLLLEAFAAAGGAVKECHVLCFGGGEFKSNEHACIDALGLTGRVHHLSGDDLLLATCYSFAEAFVFPSRYEGFGLPVLESMKYGCPTVLADVSSLPEIGGDAALYFDPSDSHELSDLLEMLLDDKSLRETMKEKGYQRAKQFSWDRCARETAAVYDQVTS